MEREKKGGGSCAAPRAPAPMPLALPLLNGGRERRLHTSRSLSWLHVHLPDLFAGRRVGRQGAQGGQGSLESRTDARGARRSGAPDLRGLRNAGRRRGWSGLGVLDGPLLGRQVGGLHVQEGRGGERRGPDARTKNEERVGRGGLKRAKARPLWPRRVLFSCRLSRARSPSFSIFARSQSRPIPCRTRAPCLAGVSS